MMLTMMLLLMLLLMMMMLMTMMMVAMMLTMMIVIVMVVWTTVASAAFAPNPARWTFSLSSGENMLFGCSQGWSGVENQYLHSCLCCKELGVRDAYSHLGPYSRLRLT